MIYSMVFIKCVGQMWLPQECIMRAVNGRDNYILTHIYKVHKNWRQNTVIAFHLKFWIIYCDV